MTLSSNVSKSTIAKTCGDGPTACSRDDADSWNGARAVKGYSWWANQGDTAWQLFPLFWGDSTLRRNRNDDFQSDSNGTSWLKAGSIPIRQPRITSVKHWEAWKSSSIPRLSQRHDKKSQCQANAGIFSSKAISCTRFR
jgi:hypothetical protein